MSGDVIRGTARPGVSEIRTGVMYCESCGKTEALKWVVNCGDDYTIALYQGILEAGWGCSLRPGEPRGIADVMCRKCMLEAADNEPTDTPEPRNEPTA